MIWCPLIFPHDVDLRDDGVRQVAYDLEVCSFRFIGGQHSLEIRDAVIASCDGWVAVPLQETG